MDVLQKISKYCADAEHCTSDVVQKLRDWNVEESEFEAILEHLRKNKFLDDQRYLHSYVSEKWNLDRWGRQKIKNKLEEKGFEEGIIESAYHIINESEYISVLSQLLEQKLRALVNDPHESIVRKLATFAGAKGFEEEYVHQWLEQKHLI
jgi:regulatory protein